MISASLRRSGVLRYSASLTDWYGVPHRNHPRPLWGAHLWWYTPHFHGLTPVATHLDRFAVRMGGVLDIERSDCAVAPPCYGYPPPRVRATVEADRVSSRKKTHMPPKSKSLYLPCPEGAQVGSPRRQPGVLTVTNQTFAPEKGAGRDNMSETPCSTKTAGRRKPP